MSKPRAPARKSDTQQASQGRRFLVPLAVAGVAITCLLAVSDFVSSQQSDARQRFRPVSSQAQDVMQQLAAGTADSCDRAAEGLLSLGHELHLQTDHYDGQEPADIIRGQQDLSRLVDEIERASAASRSKCGSSTSWQKILVVGSLIHSIILPDFYTVVEDDANHVKSVLIGITLLGELSALPGLDASCSLLTAHERFEMFDVFCTSSLVSRLAVLRRRTAMWEMAIALKPSMAPLRLHYAVSLVLGMNRTNAASRDFLAQEIAKAPRRTFQDSHHESLLGLLLAHCMLTEGETVTGDVRKLVARAAKELLTSCRELSDPLSLDEKSAFLVALHVQRPPLFVSDAEWKTLARSIVGVSRKVVGDASVAEALRECV